MNILHTEASAGYGGQEIRILRESEGMRSRGHHVILAVVKGGQLAAKARAAGFTVYEVPFSNKRHILQSLWALRSIVNRHQIQMVNTHSSWDAWVGGIAGRLANIGIVRTRHLSTPTRRGLNSRLLYKTLADAVVTTCAATAETIRTEVNLPLTHCFSAPTGIIPQDLEVSDQAVRDFRGRFGIKPDDIVVGTVCVLRFWKGVSDLIEAAARLRHNPKIKILVVGEGPSRATFEEHVDALGIRPNVIFTGYLDRPQVATAAMDLFCLLSTNHEGVSQAVLQAAYLRRPLITTATGGLAEVCIHGVTGLVVPPRCADQVAAHISKLAHEPSLRLQMGDAGREHVLAHFTLDRTLDAMEGVYQRVIRKADL